MSRANPNFRRNRSVLTQTSSAGGSASTFHGLLSYMDAKAPDWFMWENVDSIASPDDEDSASAATKTSNLDVALAEFSNRMYECQAFLVNSCEYGLPQSRKR
eukprot:581551-Alexandrium_andersonii.AAC.1